MVPATRRVWQLLSRPIALPGTGSRSSFIGWLISTPFLAISVVSCVWLVLVFLANPVGEFPLNDDWSYARAVQTLVEDGHLELTGFTSMPLIAQVLWGALFCLPFGFSFTALRISTITLGLLGILAAYWLFEEIKLDRSLAFFATIMVAANPLYFHLSLTFMTDIPFFTFSMSAFVFFLRALRTERSSDLVLGFAFSLVAIFIRQLGVVIPLAFLGANFVKNRISSKTLVYAILPTVACVILLLALPAILQHTIGLPVLYNRAYEPIIEAAPLGWFQIPLVFLDRLLVEFIYLGLFLLPVLILLGVNTQPASCAQTRRRSLFVVAGLFIAILALLLWQGRIMPLHGNVLYDLGLGPLLLRDTYMLGFPHWPTAPQALWLIVTIAAVLGSVLLICRVGAEIEPIIRLFNSGSKSEQVYVPCLLLSAALLYSVGTAITGFLDRYLIWLLPLLLGFLLVRVNPINLHISVLSFSVAVTLIIFFVSSRWGAPMITWPGIEHAGKPSQI